MITGLQLCLGDLWKDTVTLELGRTFKMTVEKTVTTDLGKMETLVSYYDGQMQVLGAIIRRILEKKR